MFGHEVVQPARLVKSVHGCVVKLQQCCVAVLGHRMGHDIDDPHARSSHISHLTYGFAKGEKLDS